MSYITAHIRPRTVHLGYDANGELRKSDFAPREFVEKVIKIDRILSVTEDHLFVACPHDTVQVWDYKGDLASIKDQLRRAGLLLE